MSEITPVATAILGNEKAWAYQEVHLQSPGSHGRHRYRIILVNRNGYLAEYREDLGPASKFKGMEEIHIPSFWEHSCDELIALAEELRNDRVLDLDELLQLDRKDYKLG